MTESGERTWIGRWRNQYGSILTIVDDSGGRIRGTFRTALQDSGFAGAEAEISGIHTGTCLNFAFARSDEHVETIASFTGLLREGRLETVWHVVADSAVKPPRPGEPAQRMTLPWPHAVTTNADTFQRVP